MRHSPFEFLRLRDVVHGLEICVQMMRGASPSPDKSNAWDPLNRL